MLPQQENESLNWGIKLLTEKIKINKYKTENELKLNKKLI